MRRSIVIGCVCLPGLAGAAAAGAAGITSTFTGSTSQNRSVLIAIRNGVVQRRSSIGFVAPCDNGSQLTGSTNLHGPLLSGNRFRTRHARYISPVNGGKLTAHHVVDVRFSIAGRRARGMFRNGVTLENGTRTVTQCDTGKVKFGAVEVFKSTGCSNPRNTHDLLVTAYGPGSVEVPAPYKTVRGNGQPSYLCFPPGIEHVTLTQVPVSGGQFSSWVVTNTNRYSCPAPPDPTKSSTCTINFRGIEDPSTYIDVQANFTSS